MRCPVVSDDMTYKKIVLGEYVAQSAGAVEYTD